MIVYGVNTNTQQLCTTALRAAADRASGSSLDRIELDKADALDCISFELSDKEVAYVLNASCTTPVSEATLRRLYLDGAQSYHLNPFTNEPLTRVAAVIVKVRADEAGTEAGTVS